MAGPLLRPECPREVTPTLSGFFFMDHGRFSFRNLPGKGSPLVDLWLPFLRGSYDCFWVLQCCSSLLLCRCRESRHEQDEYDYVVCNPMTGQWTVLPPIVWLDEEDEWTVFDFEPMHIFLGFDDAEVPSRFVVFVLPDGTASSTPAGYDLTIQSLPDSSRLRSLRCHHLPDPSSSLSRRLASPRPPRPQLSPLLPRLSQRRCQRHRPTLSLSRCWSPGAGDPQCLLLRRDP